MIAPPNPFYLPCAPPRPGLPDGNVFLKRVRGPLFNREGHSDEASQVSTFLVCAISGAVSGHALETSDRFEMHIPGRLCAPPLPRRFLLCRPAWFSVNLNQRHRCGGSCKKTGASSTSKELLSTAFPDELTSCVFPSDCEVDSESVVFYFLFGLPVLWTLRP